MLELRLSIISINPAPNKSRSERGRFMGWLVVRSFAHHATMVTLVTGPDDQHSRRRVRQSCRVRHGQRSSNRKHPTMSRVADQF